MDKKNILHPNPDPVIPKEKFTGEQVIKVQNERVVKEAKANADQIKFEKGQKKRPHGEIKRPVGEIKVLGDNEESSGEVEIAEQPIKKLNTQRKNNIRIGGKTNEEK